VKEQIPSSKTRIGMTGKAHSAAVANRTVTHPIFISK